MPDKLEVRDLGSVLNQPPHVLAVGLVDVVVDRFQVQAVHLGGAGGAWDLRIAARINC